MYKVGTPAQCAQWLPMLPSLPDTLISRTWRSLPMPAAGTELCTDTHTAGNNVPGPIANLSCSPLIHRCSHTRAGP